MSTEAQSLTKHTASIGNVAHRLFSKVSERYDQGGVELLGVPSGFQTIDRMTGGLGVDEMWVIAGATGGGKSSLALNMALNACRRDENVLFYSLEMSAESLVNRLLSTMTGVDSGRIIRGKFSSTEKRALENAISDIDDLGLYIIDSTCTSQMVREHSFRIADKVGGVGLICVDYAQLLGDDSSLGDVERLTRISNNIRNLARPDQMNAPVILLSQLNRASQSREDKTPQLHDLKGASQFEQDAHVVLLLHRPHREAMTKGAEPKDIEDDAKIIVAKNRSGPSGSTTAKFNTRTTTWTQ